METVTELRRYARQEIFSAVMIVPDGQLADPAMAMALDLSEGGSRIGLLDEWRPAAGVPLKLSFLFDTEQPIVLHGRVTRVTTDHLGIEFEPAQELQIRLLLDQVEQLH